MLMPQGFALLTEERPSNLSLDKLPRSSMQTKGVSLRIGPATSVAAFCQATHHRWIAA
jgi:hypothetical protein